MVPKDSILVVDTEHLPDCEPSIDNLLGVSLSYRDASGLICSEYVSVNHWNGIPSTQLVRAIEPAPLQELVRLLSGHRLSGWNASHDKMWLDACFSITTEWEWDGRILWFLTDREQTEVGYSLKRAQTKILKWAASNADALELQVASRGGRLSNGQHYLADVEVLATYAKLDSESSLLLIEHFLKDESDPNLSRSHSRTLEYSFMLLEPMQLGTVVDELALQRAKNFYKTAVAKSVVSIREVCADGISVIEKEKLDKRVNGLTKESRIAEILATPSLQPKFNHRSTQQRARLLYDILKLPVWERSKLTGAPSTDKKTLAKLDHPAAKVFLELSRNEKLLQFTNQYLDGSNNGIIKFPLDAIGTVTERLGGYAPYCLNMPFSEEMLMQAFGVRQGKIGIHMDLVSIEPCIIAGFSQDQTMLKIYQQGLGDVYLDLCLELFPLAECHDYDDDLNILIQTFHLEYDTFAPPDSKQKEKFSKLRKVAKIVQLAVGYTGTEHTVSRNLTQAGFPCDLDKGKLLVNRYWSKYSGVAEFNNKLKSIAEKRGFITGLFGRKLNIPKKFTKDAMNRFAQFGGHAILTEIIRDISKNRLPGMAPLLIDIHDATSWEANNADRLEAQEVFKMALGRVNTLLNLPVTVCGEIKLFNTFYGLKNSEES
jgi:DNA polymerase I-like protein with 3'-5' exonuclease and polymerase domains